MESEPLPSEYTSRKTETVVQGKMMIKTIVDLFLRLRQNPEADEAQQAFVQKKSAFDMLIARLMTMLNDIESSIRAVNKQSTPINSELDTEKKKVTQLAEKIKRKDEGLRASDERVDDFQSMYNWKYARNWAIFIGLVILLIGTYMFERNTKPVINSTAK